MRSSKVKKERRGEMTAGVVLVIVGLILILYSHKHD
jgi:hypothetical protein